MGQANNCLLSHFHVSGVRFCFCYLLINSQIFLWKVCRSYWDPRPAGLDDQWWAGSSFPCLLRSHPAPPSHFSPTGALRRQMQEETHTQSKTINIQANNNASNFSLDVSIEWHDHSSLPQLSRSNRRGPLWTIWFNLVARHFLEKLSI